MLFVLCVCVCHTHRKWVHTACAVGRVTLRVVYRRWCAVVEESISWLSHWSKQTISLGATLKTDKNDEWIFLNPPDNNISLHRYTKKIFFYWIIVCISAERERKGTVGVVISLNKREPMISYRIFDAMIIKFWFQEEIENNNLHDNVRKPPSDLRHQRSKWDYVIILTIYW